jgi:hypothetical protein
MAYFLQVTVRQNIYSAIRPLIQNQQPETDQLSVQQHIRAHSLLQCVSFITVSPAASRAPEDVGFLRDNAAVLGETT